VTWNRAYFQDFSLQSWRLGTRQDFTLQSGQLHGDRATTLAGKAGDWESQFDRRLTGDNTSAGC